MLRLENICYTRSTMSFLDKVKKVEEGKRKDTDEIHQKMPAYVQALNELWSFVIHHLRPGAVQPGSPEEKVQIERDDEYRVDGFQVGRIVITYDGKTVEAIPLSIAETRARTNGEAAGFVMLTGSSGASYELIWDGKSHAVNGHWKICWTLPKVIGLGRESLDDKTFDRALERLFGFAAEVHD
jgi:hypothetical protein